MARIDAGGVATEARRAHPSEIVAAARDQVEHTLRRHRVDVTIDPDVPVRLDPRLTASALAHLLENAAQYTPAGIDHRRRRVRHRRRAHDRGARPRPGHRARRPAAPVRAVLPRRGAAQTRTSGTGMGLWIARGLLAVEGGRVWAENSPDGGAHFTIVVPGCRRGHRRGAAGSPMIDRAPASCSWTTRSAIQRAVGPLLRARGYEVEIAGTGAEALALVAERPPDLVVLDLGLARPRGHRGLPAAFALTLDGADRRALGARRRGRQGAGARPRRRRLRHQAVRAGGTAGADPRGAPAGGYCERGATTGVLRGRRSHASTTTAAASSATGSRSA